MPSKQSPKSVIREIKRRHGLSWFGALGSIEYGEMLERACQMVARLEEAAKVHEKMARRYGGRALSHC